MIGQINRVLRGLHQGIYGMSNEEVLGRKHAHRGEKERYKEVNGVEIIVIHGAPGCGKSTVAALLHEQLNSPWFEFGWIPEFTNLNPCVSISSKLRGNIVF